MMRQSHARGTLTKKLPPDERTSCDAERVDRTKRRRMPAQNEGRFLNRSGGARKARLQVLRAELLMASQKRDDEACEFAIAKSVVAELPCCCDNGRLANKSDQSGSLQSSFIG